MRALAEIEEIHAQNKLIVMYSIAQRRRRRRRRVWVRQVFLDRAVDGDFHNLFAKLRVGDAAMFHNIMRMSPQQFRFLENLMRPLIEVRSTHLRPSISSADKPDELKTVSQGALQKFSRTQPIVRTEWRNGTSRARSCLQTGGRKCRHRLLKAESLSVIGCVATVVT